jgi:hypothetical protein
MKNSILLTIIALFSLEVNKAQTFNLTDTIFKTGDQLTRGELYDGDCHIDLINYPFIDSLANFLLKNKNISIEIHFHSDIRGNDQYNQKRTEVCGKSRLTSLFESKYPNLNLDRIVFLCFGESKPLFSQSDIDKIIDKNTKEKAHEANRRTVIKIIKT